LNALMHQENAEKLSEILPSHPRFGYITKQANKKHFGYLLPSSDTRSRHVYMSSNIHKSVDCWSIPKMSATRESHNIYTVRHCRMSRNVCMYFLFLRCITLIGILSPNEIPKTSIFVSNVKRMQI